MSEHSLVRHLVRVPHCLRHLHRARNTHANTALVYRFQNRNVGALSATAAVIPTSCVLCCVTGVWLEVNTKVDRLLVLALYTVVIVLLFYNEVIERALLIYSLR